MIITVYYFGQIILNNEFKIKKLLKTWLIFLIAIVLHTIIYLYTDGIIKTLLLCILYSLFLSLIFKTSYWKSSLMGIIYTLIMIIPDLVVTLTLAIIFGKQKFYLIFAGSIFSNFCVCVLMIALTFILRKPLRKLMNYKLSENKKIVIISVLATIFTAIFFYKFAMGYKMNQDVLIYLVSMFAFIIILFTLFRQRIDNENVSKKYDELLDVMKSYESDIEDQRTLRH